MNEIKSWSSVDFSAAASWFVINLKPFKYVERDREPCVIVCNWHFRCEIRVHDWLENLVLRVVQTCLDVFKPYIDTMMFGQIGDEIIPSRAWSFLY